MWWIAVFPYYFILFSIFTISTPQLVSIHLSSTVFYLSKIKLGSDKSDKETQASFSPCSVELQGISKTEGDI